MILTRKQIRLNQGEKWEIDESLNIGMTLIKQEVIKNLDDIHNDLFSNQQYAQLAIELDKQLAFLFKTVNCHRKRTLSYISCWRK